jgi:pilus assembly protein CpaF
MESSRSGATGADLRSQRSRLHRHLIEVIEEDGAEIERWDEEARRLYVQEKIGGWITSQRIAVNQREVAMLVEDMIHELAGLGPIQPLMQDDRVDDILVNGAGAVFVERRGRLEQTEICFADREHVLRIIQRIIAPLGRRIDESCPMVDARLADGSRVNAIIPPVALDGPYLSIRKFRREPLRAGDLLTYGTLDDRMLRLLRDAVVGRCSILVSGGTGAGKTTLLNVLSHFIPERERLITIEDAAELSLAHSHVVRLETRPPNLEGQGEVRARDLLRNALRMRPDRIIVGEVRGEEVIDMLQAMNTGHEGSMTTVHANSSRDALERLEMLVGLGDYHGSEATLRRNVASAIDLVVQVARSADGVRRVTQIAELVGLGDGGYLTHELFHFDAETARFEASNVRPVHPALRERTGGADPARAASPFRELGRG